MIPKQGATDVVAADRWGAGEDCGLKCHVRSMGQKPQDTQQSFWRSGVGFGTNVRYLMRNRSSSLRCFVCLYTVP
jgi:hypothetical protein